MKKKKNKQIEEMDDGWMDIESEKGREDNQYRERMWKVRDKGEGEERNEARTERRDEIKRKGVGNSNGLTSAGFHCFTSD